MVRSAPLALSLEVDVQIVVALITAAGLIIVALLANRTRQHAKAARVQVENDHTTNLREEGDERHVENQHSLALVLNTLMGVQSDIRGMRRDIGRLQDADLQLARDIEDTQNRTKHD